MSIYTTIPFRTRDTIQRAIHSHKNILVLGGIGTGKTYTVRTLLNEQDYLYVDCSERNVQQTFVEATGKENILVLDHVSEVRDSQEIRKGLRKKRGGDNYCPFKK